jgi:hypothetical protein
MLLAASLSALLGLASGGLGQAQDTANPQDTTNPAAGDPPIRAGRLAQIDGTVSFHTSDEAAWETATLNYPITSGNSLWTEPRAHAAVDVGGSRLYLDSSTELDIGTLDDQGFVAQLPRGAVYLRTGGQDGPFEIDTPRGAVTITQPGHYEIVAGDTDNPTTVTPLDGAAQISGPGINMNAAAGQTLSLTGQDTTITGTTSAALQDDFIAYADDADRSYYTPTPAQPSLAEAPQPTVPQQQYTAPQPQYTVPQPQYTAPQAQYTAPQPQYVAPSPLAVPATPYVSASVQYVSPTMTGYEDLDRYGTWQQSPNYGPVWMPQVSSDWAPYRHGHWAYVAPWGWTWIDDAPWGFTPFHYGRWIQVGPRWAWVPGRRVEQPVYSPALVSFVGNVAGLPISVNIGQTNVGQAPAVGWVPLGPNEVWNPPYRYRPDYFRNANQPNVDVTRIVNNTTITTNNVTIVNNRPVSDLVNRRAVTLVPAAVMANSQPVAPAFRAVPQNVLQTRLATLTTRTDQVPVRPTLRTAGVTPTVARLLGQPLPANGQLPLRQAAPGPRIIATSNGSQRNGGSLPAIVSLPPQSAGQNRGIINLGNASQQNAPAVPRAALQPQAQTQNLKALNPAGNNAGTNRLVTGTQNNQRNWSFLPSLQKPNAGQTGLHNNRIGTLVPKNVKQPQTQGQTMVIPGTMGNARPVQGAVSQGSQREGNLPPLQPQTSRNGQFQFQGQQGNAARTVVQPSNLQHGNGTGVVIPPKNTQQQGQAPGQTMMIPRTTGNAQNRPLLGAVSQGSQRGGNVPPPPQNNRPAKLQSQPAAGTNFSTLTQQQRQLLQQQNNRRASGAFTFQQPPKQQQRQQKASKKQQLPPLMNNNNKNKRLPPLINNSNQ